MNIKEHIEAGHYDKWENGRAMVPMLGGGYAQIYVTDHPSDFCIVGNGVGGCQSWTEHGRQFRFAGHPGSLDGLGDLSPPPPRKVKVSLPARVNERGEIIHTWNKIGGDFAYPPPLSRVVILTGEYEEPWS